MRFVVLLCAAFALASAAGPVEEMTDVQQNMQPDELLAQLTGESEKEEAVPAVEEDDRTPGNVSQSRRSCPPGWSSYGSRCFIFVHREMPWVDAEKYCLRYDANLASIHDSREHQFIQELVKFSTGKFTRSWIGGTDAVKDQTWFWSDGSRFNFQDWATGEPDNHGGNQRCLEINFSEYYLWNDMACENRFTFICGTRP